tara:strand:- start:29800 stop:30111 length:312 start_codon:yes stop_codon:yes gene_type:complete
MTEANTDALAKMLANATPGPWVSTGRYIGVSKHMSFIGECRDKNGNWSNYVPACQNAPLIALAPALAAEVITLRAEVARLTAINDELKSDIEGLYQDLAGESI